MAKQPQEQIIVETIAGWLREITWSNGYRTNAGLTVFIDENDVPDDATQDTLLVLDTGSKAQAQDKESKAQGRGLWTLTVTIEGLIVLLPTDAPRSGRKYARELMADVRDVLKKGRIKAQLPAGAVELREVLREIPRREPGSNLLLMMITIEIDYSDVFNEET